MSNSNTTQINSGAIPRRKNIVPKTGHGGKMSNLVRKISMKSLGLTKAKLQDIVKESEGPVVVCRILGVVRKTEVIETEFGESQKFHGDFEAIVSETGEIYRAPVAFVPGAAGDLIGGAPEGSAFAFDILVKSSTQAIGYEYLARPIIEGEDPLEKLRASLPPLLVHEPKAAPKKSAKK
jgi:hypothetical protein